MEGEYTRSSSLATALRLFRAMPFRPVLYGSSVLRTGFAVPSITIARERDYRFRRDEMAAKSGTF